MLTEALGDVVVQYVWRSLREHNIDLAAHKSWCESNDPEFVAKGAADVVGLYVNSPAKAIVHRFEQLQEHTDAFITTYYETALPFAWTKKEVYQRRFKNRRITQL